MTPWECAYASLQQGDYERAALQYEQAIEQDPHRKTAYWYLGIAALLQQQEEEAQAVWLMAMSDGEPSQIDQWTIELAAILHQEADRLAAIDPTAAWLLRQHLRAIAPHDLQNLLLLIELAVQTGEAAPEDEMQQAIEQLHLGTGADAALLLRVLRKLLDWDPNQAIVLEFASVCLAYAAPSWIEVLLSHAIQLATIEGNYSLAARYGELCLTLDSHHPPTLMSLSRFYQTEGRYAEAIEFAQRYRATHTRLPQQIEANALLLRALMGTGFAWQQAEAVQQEQIQQLRAWLASDEPDETPAICSALYFAPYLSDRPQATRALQNQVAQRYQSLLSPVQPALNPQRSRSKLRIGYLSSCLKQHSVGWLCRWIFHYFDRDRFEVYAYFHQQSPLDSFAERWFADQATCSRRVAGEAAAIAQQIRADEIDILVDLDSLTAPATCRVMALKPAPIQTTWLGWDASGLPAIDYFIADPYVLPQSAQEYYSEKIWRLPHTLIAVDGFEVGIPTLRREQLDIPADAVVYFSSQYAYKRHPETVRSQMQILKQVPNSYFCVKGLGDGQGVQTSLEQIADAEGVSRQRLRFLPSAPDEPTHRANLSLADVVLDTFPYNGATTTLEALWMGIPLVTRVGEQFASRHSYTMLINVGVTEGIAWTSQDYVAWGVQFGQNAILRQRVREKLRESRRTSPLWNGQQFTRSLERAYEQMWQDHQTAQRR